MKTGKDLLREIESWPIEAKDDDTGRYFFEIAELQAILEGKKNYVIGRKGTGKTSIARHLRNYQQTTYFAEKLTFKNFPFNILYELRDSSYTSPNQYITIWKYVIYSAVCKMMSANESLPSEVRKTLKSVFPDDIETALQVHIKKFTDRSFSLGAYGFNVGIGGAAASQFESEWTNRVSILESFISSKIDTSHYMVVFDELDEDYKDIFGDTKRSASYFDLLTSLFKACQDIRNVSKKARANIVPVIFLRSDVYELLRDPDKNKWRDRAVDLTWTKHSLRNLFAYRVSWARDGAGEILSADQAWSAISNVSTMRYGSRSDRKEDGFSYLLRSTFLRPRDVVSYVRECAKAALTSGKIRIDVPTIKAAELAHSAFARREVIDEV